MDQLVELATSTYQGVNRAHLADLLAEREQLVVAERTLRRVLAQAGLPPLRKRRPPAPSRALEATGRSPLAAGLRSQLT